jgi:hypothetical protein
VLADQVGAVDFAHGFLLQQAQPAIDLGHDTGDRRLTGAGWAREHEMVGALRNGQAALLAPNRHGDRTFQPGDLVLDLFEADELATSPYACLS